MRYTPFYLIVIAISACATSAGRIQTGEFRHFVREFFGSEAFQTAHIQFPLEVVSYVGEFEDYQVTSTQMLQEDWQFQSGPAYYQCGEDCFDALIYDTFAKTQRRSGERVLAFEGVDNGINASMYFRLINGEWRLVKIEDFSD